MVLDNIAWTEEEKAASEAVRRKSIAMMVGEERSLLHNSRAKDRVQRILAFEGKIAKLARHCKTNMRFVTGR